MSSLTGKIDQFARDVEERLPADGKGVAFARWVPTHFSSSVLLPQSRGQGRGRQRTLYGYPRATQRTLAACRKGCERTARVSLGAPLVSAWLATDNVIVSLFEKTSVRATPAHTQPCSLRSAACMLIAPNIPRRP
jgi:hypothetical protein